jgi:hypothetical protein
MMTRSTRNWTALIFATLCLALPISARAEPTRDAVMQGAERCEGIADNRVWLDCFYGSAQPMRAVLGLPAAPATQTRLVPGPGAGAAPRRAWPQEQSGGFLSALIGNTKPVASDVPMTAYDFGRDGKFTVTMADGLVWRQAESDILLAKWNKPAQSYKATITNGSATDLYNMRVNGEIYKVVRVK